MATAANTLTNILARADVFTVHFATRALTALLGA